MNATPHLAGAPPVEGRDRSAHRVLVVDDSRSQRRMLASALRRWGYPVMEAGSGEAALASVCAGEVDIVVSDWMMPGMDGIEFCRRLRALPSGDYVYFILLTSKAQSREVAHGLDIGADDFLSKPVSPDEFRARVAAGDRILRMARELSAKNATISSAFERLREVHDSLDRDLREARKLQQSLVRDRSRSFSTADIATLFEPSGHVGGDLVGHFQVDRDRVGIYALDVCGHGVASALMTARLAGYLGGSSSDKNVALSVDAAGRVAMRSPEEVCGILNALLLEEMETDLYFTLLLAEVDLACGRVRFVQAGHPRPALRQGDGRVRFLGDGGLPIGLLAGASWEVVEARLAPGDRLLFYSDGLTEATDAGGEQLEEEGLARLLARHGTKDGAELLEALVGELVAAAGARAFADDVSGVLVSYRGPG